MEHLAFDDDSFDFAYSSLAIHYIEDWRQVFTEAYRVLKPNSYFLFSCNHPAYSAMDVVKDDGETTVRELSRTRTHHGDGVKIVGDYLTRKAVAGFANDTMAVTTWHKSLGEISSEATSAGFMIADLVEPQPLPKMEEVSPTNYKTLKKIPNFVVFRLWKPEKPIVTLEMFLGMTQEAADQEGNRGTDQGAQMLVGGSTGLNFPIGGYAAEGSFYGINFRTWIWSSTSSSEDWAWHRGPQYGQISRDNEHKIVASPVRCIYSLNN
jgi:hypothetical protein